MNSKLIIEMVTAQVPGLEKCRIELSRDGELAYFICVSDGKHVVVSVIHAPRWFPLPRSDFAIAAEIIFELRNP